MNWMIKNLGAFLLVTPLAIQYGWPLEIQLAIQAGVMLLAIRKEDLE